jgi:RHS repeat-associated protein
MGSVYYHTVGGRVRGETGATRRDYLTDALGSVTGTVDEASQLENAYRFKPYGGTLYKSGSGEDPRLRWTGDTGSRTTGNRYAGQYNRARHYGTEQGQWTTVDPLWPKESAYGYVNGNPVSLVDPEGTTCQNTATKVSAECRTVNLGTGRVTWYKPEPFYHETRGCDKCKCPGPIRCAVQVTIRYVVTGYHSADAKLVSSDVQGSCGPLGNALIKGAKDIMGGYIAGMVGGAWRKPGTINKPGFYLDCTSESNFWLKVFECGPQYCPRTLPLHCLPGI